MRDRVTDVVVIGAGAAGLIAMRELDRAGAGFIGLEARNRIGGRVYTVHDPMARVPIELGAEFVHGRPREIFGEAAAAGLAICGVSGAGVSVSNEDESNDEEENRLMQDLVQAGETEPDQPFSEWVEKTPYSEGAKNQATRFVEGFNAAHREVIGIASLALDTRASEEIGADQNCRIASGYDALLHSVLRGIKDWQSKLRLNQIVEQLEWAPGSVTVHTRSALTGDVQRIRCRKVIITVPLGVLQAGVTEKGAIRFTPEPTEILQAAQQLAFGQVVRVVLRFREAFWEANARFSDASFLFSDERAFPTWWTTLPIRAPMITGWSAGPNADELLDRSEGEILERALASLGRTTGCEASHLSELLEAVYLHRWNNDPFARGAYSYVPAGAMQARETLARPVANTLYFAGEATETTGHGSTVNGAMATGARAAGLVLETL